MQGRELARCTFGRDILSLQLASYVFMVSLPLGSSDNGSDAPLEIPREDWAKFLEDFGSSRDLWTATVAVLGSDGDHDVEIRERPLEGIEVSHSPTGDISIRLGAAEGGSAAERELTHSVIRPTKLSVQVAGDVTLWIHAADGTVTVVRCTAISKHDGHGDLAA